MERCPHCTREFAAVVALFAHIADAHDEDLAWAKAEADELRFARLRARRRQAALAHRALKARGWE